MYLSGHLAVNSKYVKLFGYNVVEILIILKKQADDNNVYRRFLLGSIILLRHRSISAIFLISFGLILSLMLACLLKQLEELLKTASLFAISCLIELLKMRKLLKVTGIGM